MQTNACKQRVLYFIRYIVFLLACDGSPWKWIDEHFYRDIRLRAVLNVFFFFLLSISLSRLLELFIAISRINDGRERLTFVKLDVVYNDYTGITLDEHRTAACSKRYSVDVYTDERDNARAMAVFYTVSVYDLQGATMQYIRFYRNTTDRKTRIDESALWLVK